MLKRGNYWFENRFNESQNMMKASFDGLETKRWWLVGKELTVQA